jgi:hypothetical protein
MSPAYGHVPPANTSSTKIAAAERHPSFVEIRYYFERADMRDGRRDDAERLLLAASEDANAFWLPAIRLKLVGLYEATNRPEKAAKLRTPPAGALGVAPARRRRET